MKTVRHLFLMYIVAFACALGTSFINDSIVVNYGTQDRVAESLLIAIPVFIVLALLYFINRAVVKSVKTMKKKKPPVTEGPDKN